MAYDPELFRDRPRPFQIVAGGIVPAIIGALAGYLVGVSAPAYYAIGLLAAVGAWIAGFEHRDGWGGADRGLVGGTIYGTVLLLVHWATGADAKVSLGAFPPLLVVVTALVSILLGGLGGWMARRGRERAGTAVAAD